MVDLRSKILDSVRQGLFRVLGKGTLKLHGKSAGVALQLRMDLHGVRFHARDILFESSLRFGSICFELLLANFPGAFVEYSGSGIATRRDLLGGPICGLVCAFLY